MRKSVIQAGIGLLLMSMLLWMVACAEQEVKSTTPEPPQVQVTPPQPEEEEGGVDTRAEMAAQQAAEQAMAEEAARREQEKLRNMFVNEDIHFDFDDASLKPAAQDVLRRKAQWMRDNPDVNVVVEGHCDERGTTEYNLALGDRRANSARNFLVNLGIPASRLSTISYGEEMPVDPRHNEEAWAKNRRDHFTIQ